LNHEYRNNLKALIEGLTVEYSDKLYIIPFRHYFSFYLYLILKNSAETYGDMKEFYISKPVEVNFLRIANTYKVTRNTVKRSFRELVKMGLLIYVPFLKSSKHNLVKTASLYNDFRIAYFDPKKKRVVYSMK
jgi:hypothetical protein